MKQNQLTPTQEVKIRKQAESRRKRQLREDQHRRRTERLYQRMTEARRRRLYFLILFFLSVLLLHKTASIFIWFEFPLAPDPIAEKNYWQPMPANDYAPQKNCDDYCDGFSRDQWNLMLEERGIRPSRKAELKRTWEADVERKLFPLRYRDWGYRPTLGELMHDLTVPHSRSDAFTAIKLMSPVETHQYLDESYTTDLRDLLMCRADFGEEIINNFRMAASNWEIRKQREAEERRIENEMRAKGTSVL